MSRHGTKTAIGCGAVLLVWCIPIYIKRKSKTTSALERLVSRYLSAQAERPAFRPEVQRSQFNAVEMIHARVNAEHTHGVSAASRTTARNFCTRFASAIGLRPFFFQTSRSNQRRGFEGSRTHFWDKDFNADHVSAAPSAEHMVAMVDVDYYVDMASALADNFQPTILYSLQPDEAAASRDDYSYTFMADQTVNYVVSGGGHYRHTLWDYGGDSLRVSKTFMGLTYKSAAYLVDRRKVSPDHYLINLTPVARWSGINAMISTLVSSSPLKRFSPVDGQFTRIYIQGKNSLQVSTAMAGTHACGTIPASVDDAIATLARFQSVKLTQSAVLSMIPDGDIVQRRVASTPLLAYHLTQSPETDRAYVFPVEEAVRMYQVVSDVQDLDAKPTLTAFMSPIIHGAFAPSDTLANEQWCIKSRITDIKTAPLKLTAYIDECMREFAEMLVPDANSLDPCDLERVYAQQNRPTQRRILEASELETPRRKFKCFSKREANANCKDPRNISTINGPDKRDFSQFVYPFSDLLKQAPWYAFGKTPLEISQRVVDVLADAETAVNTDFSRFDGRISNLLRHLETIVFTRAFKRCYLPELLDLLRSQQNLTGTGRHGTSYNSGTSRGSGSPETSPNNTFDNAFVGYLALRSEPYRGSRRTAQQAWEALGIYGGDDGMTPKVTVKAYERAASQLGLKLECDQVKRGEIGITFLARIYGPDVWYGNTSSCCDIPRQLSKFHTTVNLPAGITATQKLQEKARSFFLTDKNTPLVGALATKVVELFGEVAYDERLRLMARWDTNGPTSVQYPNDKQDWMADYCQNALSKMQFNHDAFNTWIQSATEETILTPPLCALPIEAAAKVDVNVDGSITMATRGQKKSTRTRRPRTDAAVKKGARKPRAKKPSS
nr:RNA-dependent RNA polymerase [Mute swan feces associated noda-like virus 4]